jgi:hypothetical protein
MRWACVAATLLLLPASAKADVLVSISKSEQQMAVSINGESSYRWSVSTGRSGYNTPSGSFRALRLERVYYSKKFDDAPMPNSIFFYGGYAVHGTYEESKLGRPVSHGCVRLTRANAATLFALVQQHGQSNTRVVITDGPLRGYSGAPMARVHQREDAAWQERRGRDDSAHRGFTQRRGQELVRAEREDRADREFTQRRGEERVRVERNDKADHGFTQRRGEERVRVRRVTQAEREVPLRRSQRYYDFDW